MTTPYIVVGLVFLLAIAVAFVVFYVRRAASSAYVVDRQAAQLIEEQKWRAAAEAADRVEREQRKVDFENEAKDVVSPDDALDLLRKAGAGFNTSGTVQSPKKD